MNGKSHMKPLIKQSGLSLLEILVALVISLFLLGGIVQVYLGNRTAYRFTDAISRIQENGRFALDTFTSDVRMAGFMGCVPFHSDENGTYSGNTPYIQNHLNSANDTVGKYDFINQPAFTAADDNGLNNSDTLTLKGAKAGQSTFVETLAHPGSGAIKVDTSVGFQANDIVLITNCQSANIFQIDSATEDEANPGVITLTHTTTGSDPGNVNIPKNLCSDGHCLYSKDESPYEAYKATAFALQAVKYEITTSADGEPSLFRKVNNNEAELLIEGVEQLQFKFGIDTDSDGFANQYLDSTDVADMRQVKSIRIALVVRSDATGMTESDQTYQIFGTDITANDTRLRQVFTSTIAIRN